MADIVDDFLTRLVQHVPELPTDTRVRLESDLRGQWGGSKPYVAKQMNRVTRTTLLACGLRSQLPMREVFARAGVSPRTGYRLLGGK
ncbi:hypothetical protein [Pseudorhodoferax sp. Leaf274]|uniref:hypothetical protein n=1 Tax=Pseudorhodoferax sp. Leaf274 TaxID=1736318 RepID=UPI0007036999|nr:hypothetical protein [Pseudorhodoferax sp. Leaf274]KQP39669.1 hypothetical protein ASF44_08020 [Pseudorhodoferax sp. Leaf274]